MTVNCALTLYLSPWKMLSWPRARSKRLRDATLGGLWSSFSVPGAGICKSDDPYCAAEQRPVALIGVPSGFDALGGGACTEPQNNPAWNCWSGLSPETSTTVSLPLGPLAQLPPAHGAGPATRPLSYLQLKPSHGPRFQGWYCM